MSMKKLHSHQMLRFIDKTWYQAFHMAATTYPDNEAISFNGKRILYRDYLVETDTLAKALYSLGVRRGDHVALWMTNRPEWLLVRFALHKLGAVLVPLNTRYKSYELSYVLNQSDAKVLIMEEKFIDKINAMTILQELSPELNFSKPGKLNLQKFPLLKSIVCLGQQQYKGCLSWEELLGLANGVEARHFGNDVQPDDTAYIMYTSGTTGLPKGAMIAHKSGLITTAMMIEFFNVQPNDVILIPGPLFGNIGLLRSSSAHLAGAKVVLMNQWNPELALKLIESERVTIVALLPTMLIDLFALPSFPHYDTSSIKFIAIGGARVPAELVFQVKKKFNAEIVVTYGLVEGSGWTSIVPPGDTIDHISTTVGLCLPHCEVAILDCNTAKTLPPGQEGEICTKEVFPGSQFMKGYYKKPELTQETIRDGWLHSGDLGWVDEDGYLRITGRLKELIIVGGFNVSPAEIEDFLLKNPKIENVAVVGLPDERLGEVVGAFIRLKRGERATSEEIIDFCRKELSDIKVPRHVFFIEEFPLTPQGKIQKFKLREQILEKLSS